jgi:hypothetical protein
MTEARRPGSKRRFMEFFDIGWSSNLLALPVPAATGSPLPDRQNRNAATGTAHREKPAGAR